jgi:hypothetical protein
MHGVQGVACYILKHNLTILTLTCHLLIYLKCFQYFNNLITNYNFNNMGFIHLIMFSEFIQVLHSVRKLHTNN